MKTKRHSPLAAAFTGAVLAASPLLAAHAASIADEPVTWSAPPPIVVAQADEASQPVPRSAETLFNEAVDAIEAPAAEETPVPEATEPAPVETPAEEPAEEPAKAPPVVADDAPVGGRIYKPYLSARLRLELDYREQGGFEDTDFYGRLYATGRDLARGRLDFYVSARLYTDLDDAESTSFADDPYRSLDDSDGVTEDRLLQMYGDIHTRDKRLALRAGRQYIEVADYVQMDGGQLMYNEAGSVGGRVYFGHPVSYYTSVSGDSAGGGSVIGRLWEGNRSRFTFARYDDDSEDGYDQNYYVDVHQQFSETSRARGQLSVLNDEFRLGRLDWFDFAPDGESDLAIGSSYWGSFDAKTRAYSPLYDTLGELDPYSYSYARLTRQVHPGWLVSPGIALRFAETGENSYNNRDYENYDLTLIYAPDKKFSSSIAVEYWAVEDDDSFFGLSGDVRYRQGRAWEISGGASFAQYTYDTFSDITYSVSGGQTVFTESGTVIEETPFVYTYFIRGKWKVAKKVTLRAQFDIEDDDIAEDLAYRARGSVEVRY